MSEHTIPRRPDGKILPGAILNPHGRGPTPKFNRERLIAVCEREDYEPIGELIALARDPAATPYLRFEVHREIASYLYAKRRNVVISDEHGEEASIRISWDSTPPPPDADAKAAKKSFVDGMRKAEAKIVDAVLDDSDDP